MPYALRIDDEMLALFLPPARAYLAGVTTTKRPTPRGRGRGFRLWRRRTHGCGVRSHPRRGPRHSRRAARPLGRGASTRTRTHTRARARTHAHAHAHTRTRTRTRMHTLARMFARFCFNVSLFALLVLLTHVVVRGAASVLYTPPCRKRAKPTNGGQCSQRRRTQIKQPALGPTRCRPARCPLLARLLPMPIGVRGSKKRAARARARESTRTQLHHNASHTAQPHRQRDLTRT